MTNKKALVASTLSQNIDNADTLLVGSGIDASAAGALAIGAATATSVVVTPSATLRGSVLAQNVTNSTTAYQFQRVLSLSGTSGGFNTATTFNPASVLPTNLYAGGTVTLTGGTGAGQSRTIVSNNDGTFTTTPAWTTIPDNTTTYSVFASPSSIVVDTTTGRVGIGMFNTSAPTGTLHVFGGQAAGDVSGEPITLRAQDGGLNGTNGGAINITAGNSGNTAGDGGNINITAGSALNVDDFATGGKINLVAGSGTIEGSINAMGRFNASTIDRATAGLLTIGTATATSLAIGSATATSVTIQGLNVGRGPGVQFTNTVLGATAGGAVSLTGTNLTCIGNGATPSATNATNQITLGNNTAGMVLRCAATTITAISDQRDKADIQDLTLGLDFLKTVHPVQFKWDRRDWYDDGVSDGSKKIDKFEPGFIAQELDAAQTAANAEWMALTLKDNPDRWEATPLRLFPVVVKAAQELAAKAQAAEAHADAAEARLAALEAAVASLQSR